MAVYTPSNLCNFPRQHLLTNIVDPAALCRKDPRCAGFAYDPKNIYNPLQNSRSVTMLCDETWYDFPEGTCQHSVPSTHVHKNCFKDAKHTMGAAKTKLLGGDTPIEGTNGRQLTSVSHEARQLSTIPFWHGVSGYSLDTSITGVSANEGPKQAVVSGDGERY